MFHFYRQLERTDCGVACIRMIARHFGLKVSAKYLNDIADLNRLGMSIGDMLRCLNKLGFECYSIRGGIDNLWNMPLPAILHWNNSHFVVLYKISGNGQKFHIADPEQGKICYSKKDIMDFWIQESTHTGIAVICDTTSEFKRGSLGKSKEWSEFGSCAIVRG